LASWRSTWPVASAAASHGAALSPAAGLTLRAARCRRSAPGAAARARRRDRQRAGGDARGAEGAAFPTIVPARPPREAMTTPERLALVCER